METTRRKVLVGAVTLPFFAGVAQADAKSPHDRGVSIVDYLQGLKLEHRTSYVPQIGSDENAEHFIELDPEDSAGSLVTSITLRGETFENLTFKFWGRFTGREVFPVGEGISVQTSHFDPELHGLLVFSGGDLVAFL